MARIRTVKPELFFDVELGDVSIPARFLFIGLFTQADCEGRLDDSPKKIKANIFPYDEKINVEPLLAELAPRFIVRYEVEGRKYIQVRNFGKHQRLSGSELKYESKFPAVPDDYKEAPGKHLGSTQEAPGKHLVTLEREREREKERSISPKIKFSKLKNVLLTQEEFEKLKDRFNGHDNAMVWVEKMSIGIAMKGYKYKSHYLAILKWAENENPTEKLDSFKKPTEHIINYKELPVVVKGGV